MHTAFQQPSLYAQEEFDRFHREGWWGRRLLVDWFDERVRATPAKAAIIEAQRTLTYAQVHAQSRNIAAALLRLGVRHGDVVAVQCPNWAELPIVHLAADRIGAIFLPLSEGFRARELAHLLTMSKARVLFCPATMRGEPHLPAIETLRAGLPTLEHVVALRGSHNAGMPSFDALAGDDAWLTPDGDTWLHAARATADAPSHVMVSSGTTGLPKCSLFSDNNTLVKLVQQYAQVAAITEHDIAAALAPAGTGATGYNYPILAMLLHGGTSVMLEHWSGARVDEALAMMARHACTVAVAVPAQLTRLVQVAQELGSQLPALRVITNSGAKLPPSVAEAAERVFNCKVQSIYGTSEAGATAMTSVHDSDAQRRNTVGKPLAGQRVKLVDDDGREVPQGQPGEVCWRGANKSYGFLNDAQGTASAWDAEGWLHSGDLGCMDADGYLSIVGRKKDMIIRGGQNVNPGAIEEVLLGHDCVREVAIVPFEDAVLGERIAACVVSSDPALALDALKALVLAHGMAPWHQPELLVHMAELPRNAGGKIDKKSLAATATEFSRRSAAQAQDTAPFQGAVSPGAAAAGAVAA